MSQALAMAPGHMGEVSGSLWHILWTLYQSTQILLLRHFCPGKQARLTYLARVQRTQTCQQAFVFVIRIKPNNVANCWNSITWEQESKGHCQMDNTSPSAWICSWTNTVQGKCYQYLVQGSHTGCMMMCLKKSSVAPSQQVFSQPDEAQLRIPHFRIRLIPVSTLCHGHCQLVAWWRALNNVSVSAPDTCQAVT